MKTEITPLLIITKLEQYDYRGATAVAVVMLVVVLRPAAGHQSAAGLERPAYGGAPEQARGGLSSLRDCPRSREPALVRWPLILVALGFLALFLLLPLVGGVYRSACARG